MTTEKYRSIFAPNLYQGQVALVTGGGTGIGRCIAHELASLGATVVVAARRKELLQRVVDEITRLGGKADLVQMDVRKPESVSQAVSQVLEKHGRIDMLVSNAGGQFQAPAAAISDKGWRSVIDLNLNGNWQVCRTVYDQWMSDHGGRIVCITADCSKGMPLMAHSGAARAGVKNMVKTLAVEWGPSNVRINSVAPGTIIGNGMNNYPDEVRRAVFTDYAWKNPSGRLGTESEVAAAVTFLLSPGAAYINGVNLAVDGGSSLAKMMPDLLFNEDKHMPAFIGYPDSVKEDVPEDARELLNLYKRTSKL